MTVFDVVEIITETALVYLNAILNNIKNNGAFATDT